MRNPPYVRLYARPESPHLDMFIALLPLTAFSAVCYGWRPVIVVLCGILGAVVSELVCCRVMRRRPTLQDGSALYIGAAIGALMSPLTSYWVPAIGAAFAIVVVKMPFGGNGRYLFHPVAAGMALISQCMAGTVFTYPDTALTALPLGAKVSVATESSIASLLSSESIPTTRISEWLLGTVAGPIGATAVIILGACFLYLVIRRAISAWTVIPYVTTCALLAIAFPRVDTVWTVSVLLELCAGYLLFAGVFLLADPVTSPRHPLGRAVYGVLAGCLVMLLRHIGRFEDGTAFAVLLISPLAPLIDRVTWSLIERFRKGAPS